MTEGLRYYKLEELRRLSLEELRALWELVPTDRQRAYRQVYEREIKLAAAEGSDVKERDIARQFVKRYHDTAFIPIGSRWALAPRRVQDAARAGVLPEEEAPSAERPKASPKVLLGLGAAMLVMVSLVALRGGAGNQANVETTPRITPTLNTSVTPTPLALEAQDSVIQSGDVVRAAMYPINLQVALADDTSSAMRVWVVQRRAVRASEWNYDLNPDTASFLNGMSVRPVIGIPYSEDNAAWFDEIGTGTSFTLQMNTGAILRYSFERKAEVRRSDTALFRQVSPGLILLLLGQVDEEGMPTGTRPMVLAEYAVEGELSRQGELIGEFALPTLNATPTPTSTITPTPLPYAGLLVQVVAFTVEPGRLNTQLRLYNESERALTIAADTIWLALGYAPHPPGPRTPAEGLLPFSLLPGQAADLRLVWRWANEPFGSLNIGQYQYAFDIPTG